ncbi:SRPBCC domain-containing protein [Streptomyces sp. I05A-00742]|uniref:SRPBCC domain-containing protein n=1 Tax=Streptomyces sp. I05A-00742 TaxID=2732853 RepID=UPI001488D2C8|nr:SRPBCC domain-containing protein [Streptomyces sp. I05A-00742]
MREIAGAVDIAAPPHRVWEVLTDLSAYPEWNPLIRQASGRIAVGDRLALTTVPSRGRARTVRPRLRAVVPDRELCWVSRLLVPGLLDRTHRFALADLNGGGTRVVQSERFTGVLVPLFGRVITRTVADFEALGTALRRRAEGRPAAGA